MLNWKQRFYARGTECHVTDAGFMFLGIGLLMTDYDADREDNEMPRFRMWDGRVIEGRDCWWIPSSEADLAVADLYCGEGS